MERDGVARHAPPSRVTGDQIRCRAVRKLGNPVGGELRAEMRITGATGDVDLTLDAIKKVLGDYETENADSAKSGAHAAGDPRKNLGPGASRIGARKGRRRRIETLGTR